MANNNDRRRMSNTTVLKRALERRVAGLSGMLGNAARNVGAERERKVDREVRRRSR